MKRILILAIIVAICLMSIAGLAEEQMYRLKKELRAYYMPDQVYYIELIVNAFDDVYRASVERDDPANLAGAKPLVDFFIDSACNGAISTKADVLEVQWNLRMVQACLVVADAYKTVVDDLGTDNPDFKMYHVMKFLDVRKSYGGDELNEENAIEQFWKTTSEIHENLMTSYEYR